MRAWDRDKMAEGLPVVLRSARGAFGKDGHPALGATPDGDVRACAFGPAQDWERWTAHVVAASPHDEAGDRRMGGMAPRGSPGVPIGSGAQLTTYEWGLNITEGAARRPSSNARAPPKQLTLD